MCDRKRIITEGIMAKLIASSKHFSETVSSKSTAAKEKENTDDNPVVHQKETMDERGEVYSAPVGLPDEKPFWWYVLSVFSGREHTVVKMFNDTFVNPGYKAFVPVTKVFMRRKGRPDKWVDKPIFSGYIFIETEVPIVADVIIRKEAQTVFLQHTAVFVHSADNGAIKFLSYGNGENILRPDETARLLRLFGDKRMIETQIAICEGDKIRFLNCALAGLDGDFTVKHINRHKRTVEIEYTFMGTTQCTKVPVEFVDKVA
jgi:transcription antitermination factor NusG